MHLRVEGLQSRGCLRQVFTPSHLFNPQRFIGGTIDAQRLQLALQAMSNFPQGEAVAGRDMAGNRRLLTGILRQQQFDQLIDQFHFPGQTVTEPVVVEDTLCVARRRVRLKTIHAWHSSVIPRAAEIPDRTHCEPAGKTQRLYAQKDSSDSQPGIGVDRCVRASGDLRWEGYDGCRDFIAAATRQ